MHPEYNKASTYRTLLELSPTRMRCKKSMAVTTI
jgi:hypothetical protein